MVNERIESPTNVLALMSPSGSDLFGRTRDYYRWQQDRTHNGTWPYSTVLHGAPRPSTTTSLESGNASKGVNFASQDYLGLSTHPQVVEAAKLAMDSFGVHSAGSGILQGNTTLSRILEEELASFLQMPHVLLFPTGWAAGYGAIQGLVRVDDFVVLDQFAHACLNQGANAATRNVVRFNHCDSDALRNELAKIRRVHTNAGILVVTESVFSMHSSTPDLADIQSACREYGATMMLDVAHDLGALAPNGGGAMEEQGVYGDPDLVMGSFSKTFGSNGGFIAVKDPSVKQFLKANSSAFTFSNALSPVQCAVVREALSIVGSAEGKKLRARLADVISYLRGGLTEAGWTISGRPSPIIPIVIGVEATAISAWRLLRDNDVFVNLAEFPGVPVRSARLRCQVSSNHSMADCTALINTLSKA